MLSVLLLGCAALLPIQADNSVNLPRRILAIHDASPTDQALAEDPVHKVLELPLNHLGYLVERWPVSEGPPPPALLKDLAGVVLQMRIAGFRPEQVQWLPEWLSTNVLAKETPLVMFGSMEWLMRSGSGGDLNLANDLLSELKIHPNRNWVSDPLLVKAEVLDSALCAFETPVLLPEHYGVLASSLNGNVWVRSKVAGLPDAVPVFTTDWGGMALDPFVLQLDSGLGDQRLHLDLISFLSEALGVQGRPVPDPCVVNGRRAFFVQVDGDGFESVSTIRRGELAAKVFLDEIIDAFDLPFSVSIVVASLTKELTPEEPTPAMQLAVEIMARDNVEVASHTILHPLRWNEPLPKKAKPRTITWYTGMDGYEYSQKAEVLGSVEFINRYLAPKGKTCDLMLWSGDAIPPTDALRAAVDLGISNVNGGTFRWDAVTNSSSYVMPLMRWHEGLLQVYCGMTNENTFDGFFSYLPSAFRHIDATITNSGRGRILKPVNAYVHFYGGERPARLAAMQRIIRKWGVEEETTPIFTSRWWSSVSDAFLSTRIAAGSDGSWIVSDFGTCATVRFDGPQLPIDLTRSSGVLGFHRIHDSLYVHLYGTRAEIHFGSAAGITPYLQQANYPIESAQRGPGGLAWQNRSFGRRLAIVAGLPPDGPVHLTVDGKKSTPIADSQGQLVIEQGSGSGSIQVRLP
ncbi:MAG: hypothetical protein GY930_03425 [bacterium]|nr:hypothetical protein [bacterium]